MKHGKYEVQKAPHSRRGVRVLMVALAVVLAVCCATGGTIAWLTAQTSISTGTFTMGKIELTLSDADANGSSYTKIFNSDGNSPTYIPGNSYKTFPTVTVKKDSVPCYLFIHIKEVENSITVGENSDLKIIQYTLSNPARGDNGYRWTAVTGHAGYYYTQITASQLTSDCSYQLFEKNLVTVNGELTSEAINGKTPSITISAAAIQSENLPDKNSDNAVDAMDAWKLLPKAFTTTSSSN